MTEPIQIGDRLLVLYDGQCGLCIRAVRWLLRRDRRDRLRFAASGSPKAAARLAQHGFGATDSALGPSAILNTILAVRNPGGAKERVLVRSDAVLALLGELPLPWRAVGAALEWIPRPLRDAGYRFIARWRYRIWGRLESCPMPTAEERGRFV